MERGFLVQARSTEVIRSIAHNALDSLNLKGRSVPILNILENVLPLMDDEFSLLVLEPAEMFQRFKVYAEGMTVHRENCIYLRADVYAGACSGNGRDRFTAAHELGHYLLHKNEGMSFPRRSDASTKVYCDSEWQANTFAREFLADLRYFHSFDGPYSASQHYGVSTKVAEIQWNSKKKMAP
ncbi:hypothetical protein AWB73_01932 [Caballeronia turbans]|nr:hypothetical protein AWB73_01932 [Caballeronia turbans]